MEGRVAKLLVMVSLPLEHCEESTARLNKAINIFCWKDENPAISIGGSGVNVLILLYNVQLIHDKFLMQKLVLFLETVHS